MGFAVKKAVREKIHAKIALMGASGSGKTYSALKLATGMASELERINGKPARILMANTEAARGRYYADEFNYDIGDMSAPFSPESFIDVINYAVDAEYDILIIDSSSHEWEGKGGCLELHQQAGGQYNHWAKVTPRHNKFIETLADSPIHIIATMRGKDQYEMEKDDRGKTNVRKLGVGAKQRDGFEYEFTCTFLLDQQSNTAVSQKDNTHLFENDGPILLTEKHGEKIIEWANSGDAAATKVIRDQSSKPATNGVDAIKQDIKSLIEALQTEHKVERSVIVSTLEGIITVDGKATANYNSIQDAKTGVAVITALKDLIPKETKE